MATVRIFTYPDPIAITAVGRQPVGEAVIVLKEPYLGGETLEPTTGSAASSSTATAPADTKLVRVQVEDGSKIHYEVTPKGFDLRTADSDSPILTGNELLAFGPEYRISFLVVS